MNPRIRHKLHEVIYEADTPAGRRFDLLLLAAIALSVFVTMLDSVETLRARHGRVLDALEWTFTALFALEYALRLLAVSRPLRYASSPLGIIDLLGWLPTVVELLVPGSQYLTTVRVLRIFRVFRVLKLSYYLDEARYLADALRTARRKILVFLSVVLMLVTILGSVMYLVESGENGFTSIPQSIYWSIVTQRPDGRLGTGGTNRKTPECEGIRRSGESGWLGQKAAGRENGQRFGTQSRPTGH